MEVYRQRAITPTKQSRGFDTALSKRYLEGMRGCRWGVVVALGLVACSNDEFTSDDGGDASSSDDAMGHADGLPPGDAEIAEGGSGDGGGSTDGCLPNLTFSACDPCLAKTCCVEQDAATCTDPSSCGGGFGLACRALTDCASLNLDGGTMICCLEFDAGIQTGCPAMIRGTQGTAQCVAPSTCGAPFLHLCSTDLECGNGHHCIRAEFVVDQSALVGVCE